MKNDGMTHGFFIAQNAEVSSVEAIDAPNWNPGSIVENDRRGPTGALLASAFWIVVSRAIPIQINDKLVFRLKALSLPLPMINSLGHSPASSSLMTIDMVPVCAT